MRDHARVRRGGEGELQVSFVFSPEFFFFLDLNHCRGRRRSTHEKKKFRKFKNK